MTGETSSAEGAPLLVMAAGLELPQALLRPPVIVSFIARGDGPSALDAGAAALEPFKDVAARAVEIPGGAAAERIGIPERATEGHPAA
ncbi:carbonic anhydrase [Cereibacter johrii]|uniref:carbonic anhydrase n=1 Tax=Cereibacter johrii TaxID=445629 RepID=UPI000DCE6DF5|nr:carbonic anhydrase [Cereibacter johrii]RAZ81824.1 carbonic anhydrase [Cereibacter johrii]